MHLYLAITLKGNPIDFYLHKAGNQKTTKHFFKRFLQPFDISIVNQTPAYPITITELKKESDRHQTSKISNL